MFGAMAAQATGGGLTDLIAPLFQAMGRGQPWENAGIQAAGTGLVMASPGPWRVQGRLPERPVLAFQGELHNQAELLDRLGIGVHSLEQVLLQAFVRWGEWRTLEALRGRFALAYWSPDRRTLTLACDRTAEVELFYGRCGDAWLFGSDFSLFRPLHERLRVDRRTLSMFVRYGFVPAPHTFYREVRKLSPGHCVTIREDFPPGEPLAEHRYGPSLYRGGERPSIHLADTEAALRTFETLLEQALVERIGPGSVGAYLSSGFDSTLGAALTQRIVGAPLDTFTARFEGVHVNEAPAAGAIARHLRTRHHEVLLTDRAMAEAVQAIPRTYGEPLADSSQLPSMLLARAARERVDQVISGDGADCVLGEYPQRLDLYRAFLAAGRLPEGLRRSLAQALPILGRLAPRAGHGLALSLAARLGIHDPGRDALEDVCGVLAAADPVEVERTLCARVLRADRLVIDPQAGDIDWHARVPPERFSRRLDRLVQLQGDVFLPSVLRKTLGACEAAGLRVAMPFLDARLLDFARELPHRLRFRGRTSKWLQRQVVYRYIPPALLDRPKLGFSIWLSPLLQGALRDWAEHLLEPRRLEAEGFFHVDQVRREWDRLLHRGESFREERLWSILMFQQWLDNR